MNQLIQRVKVMEISDPSDSDWGSSPERNTGSPKKGRRAATSKTDLNAEQDDIKDVLEDTSFLGDGGSAPPKPPRRRTSGWGDTSAKSARGKRSEGNGFTEEPASINDDNQTDAMTIPDLDDFQEEEMASQIAKAPQVAVNRVATYKELDSDLSRHSSFAVLDTVDLKALTKFLSPESEVQEDDVPWTWDSLIADVSSTSNRNSVTVDNDTDK